MLKYIGNGTRVTFSNNFKIGYKNKPYTIFECPSNLIINFFDLTLRFTELKAKYIFRQILLGVNAMHEHNICHRNLSLDSIYLDEDYNIKIIDYDFCCINKEDLEVNVGRIGYFAPELAYNKKYNGMKCDIFSLGQILIGITLGIQGFNFPSNNDEYYNFIMRKKYELYWEKIIRDVGFDSSNSFKDLFVRMVAYKPKERPSINEILSHEWFEDINNLSEEEKKYLEKEIKEEFENRVKKI